jgi:hypothetical protein
MNMDDDQQVWSSPMMLIKIIAILSKLWWLIDHNE